MAKLKVLPEQAIISGFKGKVDFYLWKGIPCARKWPSSPGHNRAPAVEAQWQDWTYASRLWQLLSPEVQQAYIQTAHGTNLTGRDLAQKAYLSGYIPP